MLQPVLRRTWAPRGQTPIQREWNRHDRLSVITAVTMAPQRRRFGLYWDIQDENIRGPHVVDFLRSVRGHLRRDMVLILDRWSVHKSAAMRRYLERHCRSIQVEWLPAYAPELNPAEQVWNHTKHSDLPNLAPQHVQELGRRVHCSIRRQRRRPALLRSFFETARLEL